MAKKTSKKSATKKSSKKKTTKRKAKKSTKSAAKKTTTKKSTKKKSTKKKSAKKSAKKNPDPVMPTKEQIETRAFQVWERKGKPEGLCEENWKQAEAELIEELNA